MKILIVDDNVAVQEIIKDILVDEGHIVRLASTVDEAVEKTAAFEPDIVMLDTKVGEDDGLRMISRITEADHGLPLKVILIKSASEQMPTDNTYIRGYIDKPFKSSDVLEALRDVVDSDEAVAEEPKKKAKRTHRFFGKKADRIAPPAEDISERGVVFGLSYIMFEPEPEDIYKFIGLFDPSEYSILVVTSDKAKAIKERFSYGDMTVMPLSSGNKAGSIDIHGVGTLVAYIKDFIEQKSKPVIVFDTFNDMIDADGLNLMLLMVHQLIHDGSIKDRTYAISVDEGKLTAKDRGILLHDMNEYKF